ncbi:MAG: histidinol-phosphatase HisJ family protein [Syntrophobacteraceae bacterium]
MKVLPSMKHDLNNFDYLKTRDLHVHVPHSNHAQGTMEECIHVAIDLGLDEIGFLAHAEAGICGATGAWLTDDELDAYWEEGCALRQQYEGCITVSLGLELGINPYALPALMALKTRHPWDLIGLAYHYLPDEKGHLNICSRQSIPRLRQVDALGMTLRYYEGLRDAMSILRPTMVCHLDVIRRHLEDRSNDPRVKSLIRQVLREMERAGAALEVNTSGYDTVDEPYPAAWIISEAVEMGIDLVLCSDSHQPSDVGKYFNAATLHISRSLEGIHLSRLHRKLLAQEPVSMEAIAV